MLLADELTKRLNDETVPIETRVKIAQNALISPDFQFVEREDIVINWFYDNLKKNSSLWSQLYASLSTNIHYLNNQNKKKLIKLTGKHLKSNIKDAEKVALYLLESSIFNYHFKQNMSEFISLNSNLFKVISSEKEIECLLNNITTYFNSSSSKKEFVIAFIKTILPSFFKTSLYKSNFDKVVSCTSNIVFTNVVHQNLKQIINNINENSVNNDDENDILKELLNLLICSYNEELFTENIFQIIISAFLSSYKADSLCIYYFYSLLIHLLQLKQTKFNFDLELPTLNYEKSLTNLHSILLQLISLNIDWNVQIENLSFSDYIKSLISNLLKSNECFDKTLDTLSILIKLTPVVIESELNEILAFALTVHKNENEQKAYTNFIFELLSMFSKLHRENKFISVLLKSSEAIFNSSNPQISPLLCVNDVLPEAVKRNLANSFESLSSKNYIAIFRTLSFQLNNDIVDTLEIKTSDPTFILLVNIEIELIITFLKSVSPVEDTTAESSFIRFITSMNEFQQILSKLGTKLLNIEHRCDIMSSFLNLCYVWAELYITILHYNTIPLDIKTPVTNLSMLFSYFTKEQWKSVEQRIVNFGEFQCKQTLRKIQIQKIRAKVLLSGYEEINKKSKSTLFLYDLMSFFDEIFEDSLDMKAISEKIISGIKNESKFHVLQSNLITRNEELISSILVQCLTLIYKELKIKRKHKAESTDFTFLTRKVLKIDIENVLNAQDVDFSEICTLFETPTTEPSDVKINNENIIFYLTLIKNLPFTIFNDSIKTYILLVSMALYSDFKNLNSDKVTSLSEEIFFDIAKNNFPKSFVDYIKLETIIMHTQNYKNFNVLVSNFIEMVIKQERIADKLGGAVKKLKSLLPFEKLVDVVTTFIMSLKKLKKDKLNTENQLAYDKIYSKLINLMIYILNDDNSEREAIIGAYAVIINKFCTEDDPTLEQFLSKFESFFQYSLDTLKNSSTSTNSTLFLNTIIKHRQKLSSYLPKDFIVQCAIACKNPSLINLLYITEIADKDEFETIINSKILEANITLKSNNLKCITFIFDTWKTIILASTSTEKKIIKYQAIEHVLDEILFLMRNDFEWSLGVLDLCQVMLQCKQMEISPVMIDVLFQILAEIKYPYGNSYDQVHQFATLFKSVIKNLGILISFRAVLIMDKIPNILQVYRLLLKELCLRSNSNVEMEFKETLYQSAHEFLKFNESLIKHKRELARLAPYLIADILLYYEQVNFYPEIKDYLNQCLYELLGICDSHMYPFLLRNLSAPSQEIFKALNNEYKKFYRFTGKS